MVQKVTVTLTFDLGLIIANGFFIYVKPHPPASLGGASFHPKGIIWTVLSEDL